MRVDFSSATGLLFARLFLLLLLLWLRLRLGRRRRLRSRLRRRCYPLRLRRRLGSLHLRLRSRLHLRLRLLRLRLLDCCGWAAVAAAVAVDLRLRPWLRRLIWRRHMLRLRLLILRRYTLGLRLRPQRLARRGLRRRSRPHVSRPGGGRLITGRRLDLRPAGSAGLESPGMGRTAGLRRYGGLGCRMPRSARLKLSGSPRRSLDLARPSGYARLGCTGLNRSARLKLTRPSGYARLHRPGVRSYAGLKLSGSSWGPGGCRLPRQGGSHRTDLLVRRQLLDLPLLLRGQLHGGPGR